jgi:hypothetical protein
MSTKNRVVGGVRRRGFGRCGIKPKREIVNHKEITDALNKALARLGGVSVEQQKKTNKAIWNKD